ncbi:MAG: TRAP transporter substrate-binding protein DctP [Syntrophaceae bacterium]|nr:TRAP transporter substrate-binding protein DctP [Syntrophaceae bacterium]
MKKRMLVPVLTLILVGIICSPSIAAIHWKWVHNQPVDSMIDEISISMIKEIEEKSEGQIEISLFPASQLGDWMEMSEQIMRGSINIGILPVSPAYNQAIQIRVLPYSVMNWSEARKAFLGDNPFLSKILEKEMDKIGLKALGVIAEGFGGVGFAKVPDFDVIDPDTDKHGLKMRVTPGNQAIEAFAKELGFIPASVPWAEVFMALQTKLVDCQMGGQPYTAYSTFLDVTKMWVQMNTHFQQSFVYMNKKQWEALAPELQQIVQKAVHKYVEESFALAEAEDKHYMEEMEKAGVKVVVLSDEQLGKIASKIRKNVWPIMEDIITKENMDTLLTGLGLPVSQ